MTLFPMYLSQVYVQLPPRPLQRPRFSYETTENFASTFFIQISFVNEGWPRGARSSIPPFRFHLALLSLEKEKLSPPWLRGKELLLPCTRGKRSSQWEVPSDQGQPRLLPSFLPPHSISPPSQSENIGLPHARHPEENLHNGETSTTTQLTGVLYHRHPRRSS